MDDKERRAIRARSRARSEKRRLAAIRREGRRFRDDAIIRLRADGWTLKRIAERCGISKARVRQIVEKERERREGKPPRPPEGPFPSYDSVEDFYASMVE